MRFRPAPLLLSLALSASAIAQSSGTLLVANQKAHTLSVIDPVAAREIASIPITGIAGHEVATSPDGRTAFVPIYGDSGVGRPGTDGQTMLVVDIPTRSITRSVDFGHPVRPHLPIYDRSRNLLFVSTELDQAITAIDPKTFKVTYTVPTGQLESHMFTLSHNGHRAYTANVGAHSVSVIDLDARKVLSIVPLEGRMQRISVSNDDKLVFTSDWDKPRLAVIDTATRRLKTWITLPASGYGSASTRDGRWLLLALPLASKVAVIDLSTLQVARTIDVPSAPQEVLIRPDGKVAYISCNVSHQVAAIDISSHIPNSWTVQHLIEPGNGADGLAWLKAAPSTTAATH